MMGTSPIKTVPDVQLTVPPICRREIVPCDMLDVVNRDLDVARKVDVDVVRELDAKQDVTDDSRREDVRARRRARRKAAADEITRAPKLSRPSRVVDDGEALRHVMECVPMRHRGRDAQCVYSTADDGVSLGTLYERVRSEEPVILLVRDTGGAVFGAFAATGYRPDAAGRYSGTGEAFVFSVRPERKVYQWRRTNNFFHLCTNESLAIGGGGAFALFLDNMLWHGASGKSDTFGNVCLASAPQFEAVVVEAYRLVVPARLDVS